MKVILFLASKGGPSANLSHITEDLNKIFRPKDFKIEKDVYSNLEYSIIKGKASIYSPENKKDIKDYDLIVPTTWQRTPEQATAVALYLASKKVPIISSDFSKLRSHSKLTEYFTLWQAGLSIPNTIYSKNVNLVKMIKNEKLNFPLILKDAFKHKGNLNFYVTTLDQARSIARNNKNRRFIVQEFIPNNFDYRIILFGHKPSVVFKRARIDKTSHLNSTSRGGKATKIALPKMEKDILLDAVKATKILNRKIAGVDVIVDSISKKHYFLEVNYAPQIRTGSFAKEKMKAFVTYLKSEIK